MNSICRIVFVIFAVAWVAAFGLYLVGTFGLFGQEPGALAGVFLVPLGLPWNVFLSSLPEPLLPWMGVLAPGVNLAIIWGICRVLGRAR